MKAPDFPLTIYYDGGCPMCTEEMHALRDYDRHARLRLVDCSPPDFRDDAVAAAGLPVPELMKQIHARDAAGRWYRGVEVFELAYQAAGIEAIARLWANPRWRPLWDRLYPWIARHRMPLSRLGLNAAFGCLVRRAARKAQRRGRGCSAETCDNRD